jgi:2-polyprenyl-3-methyl-5-hydroxy-6-metoxy-1,4-benzoquinol methylase
VAGCCDPTDYRRLFSRKSAARDARSYRQRGLRGTSLDLVRLAGDVRGASVLDVGGGVGAIELELLAAGAERATSVELSGGYEEAAAALVAEHGVENRVERRVGDFVTAEIEPHDIVVMHRVVCCYPDVDALVGTAAERTRRTLLLTYPQDHVWVRLGLRTINLWLRLTSCGFRTYAHPVTRIVAAAEAHGLQLERREANGRVWESAVYRRMPV